MKITVVSPHRDDAAFSVGLAIGAWVTSGYQVEILNCFTKSIYSPFARPELVSGGDMQATVSEMRRQEDLRWIRSYPREVDLTDLKMEDAPERLKCGLDEICGMSPKMNDPSIAGIHRAVELTKSAALVIPLGIGDHVDHVTAHLASRDGWPEPLPVAFYEDLPYSARPDAAATIQMRAEGVDRELKAAFVSGPGNLKSAIEEKRRMARYYDSQIDSEVAEQIACFCERYHGRERLWVNRAWCELGLGVSQ